MRRPRVYHDRRPLVTALRVLAILAGLVILLFVFAFFWCRRYVVIEDGELHLEPPWPYSSAAD